LRQGKYRFTGHGHNKWGYYLNFLSSKTDKISLDRQQKIYTRAHMLIYNLNVHFYIFFQITIYSDGSLEKNIKYGLPVFFSFVI
jgi:hypothetical protein